VSRDLPVEVIAGEIDKKLRSRSANRFDQPAPSRRRAAAQLLKRVGPARATTSGLIDEAERSYLETRSETGNQCQNELPIVSKDALNLPRRDPEVN
jgi:hypothetical protein